MPAACASEGVAVKDCLHNIALKVPGTLMWHRMAPLYWFCSALLLLQVSEARRQDPHNLIQQVISAFTEELAVYKQSSTTTAAELWDAGGLKPLKPLL